MWDRKDTAQLKLCLGILGYVALSIAIHEVFIK